MRVFLTALTLFAISAISLWGQATARMHGTVQDQSGAAVPGASVKATNTDTGIVRTIDTQQDGSFVLTNLEPGPYSLEVQKQGFATLKQAGIVLQVDADPAIPVSLRVGAASETVSVEANAAQVETTNVGVGTVVENQRVVDLPLNGRNATDLIMISGSAVQTGTSPTYSMQTGYTISVAGGDAYGVQYLLDGADYVNYFDGTGLNLPFPDALQEFKLSTSTQDASSTGRAGATVNAVTKSGTNTFHGDAFEFLRNYDVNARDFFALRPDGLKRNQFGGVLGGPIKKDRLFFFMGYQGTFTRQTPFTSTQFVPTAAMLNGDFSTFASPACQGRTVALSAPFVNDQLPVSLLSPAAVAISKQLPTPINQCGQVNLSTPLSEDDHQVTSRVDYQLSDKQSLFVRYQLVKQIATPPFDLQHNVLNGLPGENNQLNTVAIGDTYLFSSTIVNSFRADLNRVGADQPEPNLLDVKSAGIGCAGVVGCTNPNFYTYTPGYVTVNASAGGFYLGNGQYYENSRAYATSFGVNDNFSIVHGSHQFSFGGSINRSLAYWIEHAWDGAAFTISATSGTVLGDFLLGRVSSFRQANPLVENITQNFVNLHAQDTWKVNSRLTVNYGVIWDPFQAMNFRNGDAYAFNLGNYYADVHSSVVAGAPPGFSFPGDPGFPGTSGVNSDWRQFDPRIGLAYDPFGDGKTAIRVGAGMAHDFISQGLNANTEESLPYALTVVETPGAQNGFLDNPYPQGSPFPYNYNSRNPAWPTAATAFCLVSLTGCPPSFLPTPSNMKTIKQQTWNAGIQRQITRSVFVSATYIGSEINHLVTAVELNPGVEVPGVTPTAQNVNSRRTLNLSGIDPSQPLSFITAFDDGGTQGYNGLQLNTTVRRGGVSVSANYTYSHCIGLLPVTLLNPGQNYVHQGFGQNEGPADRDLDVGNCTFDRRQIAYLTIVYQTPTFSHKAARIIASDWTVSTVFQARSGAPVTAFTGTVVEPVTGFGGTGSDQRVNQILPSVAAVNQGKSCSISSICVQWLNPAAFAAPAVGTLGNMGYASISGPGFWQWDAALSRQVRITEGTHIELRFEGFNLTNSLRLGSPSASLSSPTFGGVTSDATPASGITAPARVMQFAMKFVF